MDDIKLYHYTSIETLALILKHRTLRFNRLDKVNDPQEEKSFTQEVARKSQFVSCWTKNPEESLPMWFLYASGAQGVRIEATEGTLLCQGFQSEVYVKISDFSGFEMENADGPLFKYIKINYDGPKQSEHSNFTLRDNSLGKAPTKEEFLTNVDWVEHKSAYWQYEAEYRLAINAIGSSWSISKSEKFLEGLPEKLDLSLPIDFFKHFCITLGPKVSDAQRIIVASLLNEHVDDFDLANRLKSSDIEIR